MSQNLTVKIAGVHTYPSDLSAVPEGALSRGDNIFVDRDNEAEPRRGFGYLTHGSSVQSQYSDTTYRAAKLLYYQNKILSHYGAFGSPNTLAYHDSTSGWTNYSGTFLPPTGQAMRAAQANQNFYFTTSKGVYKLDVYSGTPSAAGVPAGLDVNTSIPVSPAATWLAVGYSSAYRVLWGIKDANSNVIYGAPTQRSEITNTTAATAAVTVVSTIPAAITTAHFYQLYRSAATNSGTSAGFVEPNDELGLVYEGNPTAGDLSNGYITITDLVPDALRGATIYTAQSQLGLANSNEPPPLALDLAVFRNCLFYGNTSGLQSQNITLLGVGSPNGIQVDDTLTIGGVTYTGKAAETVASRQFAVVPAFVLTTTGSTNSNNILSSVASVTGIVAGQTITGSNGDIPVGTFVVSVSGSNVTMNKAASGTNSQTLTFTGDSAAQAIRDTAQSLVRVINRYSSSTVYAYYLSGPTDLPGMILLQARTVGAAAFTAACSRTLIFNPDIGTTTATSTNDAKKNGLFYSQVSEPEAVPLGNFLPVGSADKNILRIIALRDSLFILKEDGIFMLTGTDPTNFEVFPLDYTAVLLAPESAVAMNNSIWALTTQGVVTITQNGVQIMSHPIEDQFTSRIADSLTLLQTSSFGVAYESARAYYIFFVSNSADVGPTQYWRYNYITKTWTHGTLAKNCGAVNPADDKLYLGNVGLDIIDVERKSLTYVDYADYASTQTISAVSGVTVTMSSVDTISVGSIIYQSASVFGTVATVNAIAGTLTTTLATSLVAGAADVLAPIATGITWVPVTLANPGMSKHLREVGLLFKSDFNGTATVGFSTDINPGVESETISGGNVGGWGEFGWGGPNETPLGAPWGGDNRRRPIRVVIPRNHQRSSVLSILFDHAYGFSPWQLQGVSVIGDIVSERTDN